MLLRPRAAWDVAVARPAARDTFTDATMSKNNQATSFRAVKQLVGCHVGLYSKGHKCERTPVLWPLTRLLWCLYIICYSFVLTFLADWSSLNDLLKLTFCLFSWCLHKCKMNDILKNLTRASLLIFLFINFIVNFWGFIGWASFQNYFLLFCCLIKLCLKNVGPLYQGVCQLSSWSLIREFKSLYYIFSMYMGILSLF